MPSDMEPRLLRAFVAVAEELHFTRAAARLYLAQQALSRDIRRLERAVGAELFVRTTRQVALTDTGARLLPYARRVLGAYDELDGAILARDERPLLVDVSATVGTAHRILEEARRAAPDCEFAARFHSGLTGAAGELLSGRLDVSAGRIAGLDPAVRGQLAHRLVRFERLAVLLAADHPLAAGDRVPLDALAGETLYAGAGNPATAEWTDLAEKLFWGRGISIAAPYPEIDGPDEFVRVVRRRGWSVLASTEFIEVPGMVLRPIVDPVPLAPVSLVWRQGLRHPGLEVLLRTAETLATGQEWLRRPEGSWLPETDVSVLSASRASPGQVECEGGVVRYIRCTGAVR